MRGTWALRTCALFGGDVSGSKAGMRLKLESAFSHYCWELSPLFEQAAPRWKDKWGAEEDKHGRLISTSQQEGAYIYVWVLLDVGCECMCVDVNVCKQKKVSGGGSGGVCVWYPEESFHSGDLLPSGVENSIATLSFGNMKNQVPCLLIPGGWMSSLLPDNVGYSICSELLGKQ